ncbi:MAG: nitroreductase/quinone reductase family protein [Acidobacteriota bacterium]
MNEEQFLYLTTTGRKTGAPREIEIWLTYLGQRYYLIAEQKERANWVQNILHQPRISFRISNQIFSGTGRMVNEAIEYELLKSVRALSEQKYGWSEGLVVELTADE